MPEGWSDWHAWIGGDPTINDNGDLTCTANNQSGNCPRDTLQPTATDYHQTDVSKHKAKAFVNDHAGQGNPFFLYLADHVPHNENPPADRHAGSHEGATLPSLLTTTKATSPTTPATSVGTTLCPTSKAIVVPPTTPPIAAAETPRNTCSTTGEAGWRAWSR